MKLLCCRLSLLLICWSLVGCGPDYVKRFDTPLSYEQMVKEPEIQFPFPRSSSNIHHARYSNWQAFAHLVCFEAPVEDCVRHIDTVLAWREKESRQVITYRRVPIAHVGPVGASWLKSTAWFHPEKITNGLFVEASSHAGPPQPKMWVDLDRGVFYYKQSD